MTNKLDVYLVPNCIIGKWAFENCNDVVLHYPGFKEDFYNELDARTYDNGQELYSFFGAYKVTVDCSDGLIISTPE